MARQALPIVGAIIGSFFPGAGTQIGFVIGSLIGNAIDPQVIKGPSLGEGQTQTSKEGVPRPIVWGTAVLGGNVIDHSEIYKSIKRERSGKGGGPVTESERMHMTYAIRICEGPIEGVSRIWEDEKLVYDIRPGGQVENAENVKYKEKFRLYLGAEDQLPDPELEVVHGVGNAPAYPGTAYIVFPRNDVTDRRGSIPQYRFEVVRGASRRVYGPLLMLGGGGSDPEETGSMIFSGLEYNDVEFTGYSTTQPRQVFEYSMSSSVRPDGQYYALTRESGNSITTQVFKLNELGSDFTVPVSLDFSAIVDESGNPITIGRVESKRWSNDGQTLFTINQAGSTTGGLTSYAFSALRFDTDTSMSVSGYARELKTFDTTYHFGLNDSATKACFLFFTGSGTTSAPRVYSIDSNGALVNPGISGIARSGVNSPVSYIDFDASGARLAVYTNYGIDAYNVGLDNTLELYATGAGIKASVGIKWSEEGLLYAFNGTRLTPDYSVDVYRIDPDPGMTPAFKFVLIASHVLPNAIIFDDRFSNAISFIGREYFSISTQNGATDVRAVIGKITSGGGVEWVNTIVHPNFSSGSNFSSALIPQTGGTLTAGKYPLASIVEDVCDRMGIPANKVDTADIEGISVDGVVAAQQYTGGNILRAIQDSYFFDPGEWDAKLRFKLRGKDVVAVLTIEDLYDDPYNAERKSAIEYPRKIELIYQNAKIGYDVAKAVSERNSPSFNVSGSRTLEVPVVLTEDNAARIADKQHKVAWAEAAGDITISTSDEWDTLTPTDCIGIVLRDTVRRVRIESIEREGGVLKFKTKEDRQSAYTSNVSGIPLPAPPPPPPTIAGQVTFEYMNAPALTDMHDVLGYYVAGGGETQAYYGAVVERSIAGSEFTQVAELPLATTIGKLVAELPASSEHYTDTTNVIRVQLLPNGLLESVNQEQFLREGNAAAIVRPDSTVEIVQFRDATLVGDNLYELSYLIRGRLNSGATTHAIGATFVFLDSAVRLVTAASSALGATLQHRATAYGERVENSAVYSDIYQPALMQTEFPVDQLKSVNPNPPGITTVTSSWSPRERFGTDINPIRSVNWSGYRITYSDGTNFESFDIQQPRHVAQLPSFSGTVTVTVYQLNRITGAGPGVSTTVQM